MQNRSPGPAGASEAGSPRRLRLEGTLLICALLFLLPNLAVFGVRAVSVATQGVYDETTGTERVPIYGIWKASHGYPVYERPFADNYYPALYNFFFYDSYGAVARLLHWEDSDLVTGSRFLTTTLALTGAWICAQLIARLLRQDADRHHRVEWWMYATALGVWLSSAGVSWFYLTVRPDIESVLFATAGLWMYVIHGERQTRMSLAGAGLLFFAAWACKHSTIGMFAGVAVTVVAAQAVSGTFNVRRLTHDLICLCLPFVLLVAASLIIGGSDYRFNVLVLPVTAKFTELGRNYVHIARVFGANPALLAVPFIWGWTRFVDRRGSGERWPAGGRFGLRLLSITTVMSWVVCGLALARDGGYRNSLLEAHISTSLLGMYLLPSTLLVVRHRIIPRALLVAAIAVTAGFPIAQILYAERLGTITVSDPARFREAVAIAASLRQAPAPLFSEDYMFAEPWVSTGGRFPALVFDGYLYHQVRTAGKLEAGLEDLIKDFRFGSLLLTGTMPELDRAALSAGYVPTPLPPHSHWNVTLYVRRSARR